MAGWQLCMHNNYGPSRWHACQLAVTTSKQPLTLIAARREEPPERQAAPLGAVVSNKDAIMMMATAPHAATDAAAQASSNLGGGGSGGGAAASSSLAGSAAPTLPMIMSASSKLKRLFAGFPRAVCQVVSHTDPSAIIEAPIYVRRAADLPAAIGRGRIVILGERACVSVRVLLTYCHGWSLYLFYQCVYQCPGHDGGG